MKARPMIFSSPMVRALLAGQKTQTRRVIKHADILEVYGRGFELRRIEGFLAAVAADGAYVKRPYGVVGDRLWVRETYAHLITDQCPWRYKATDDTTMYEWKSSMFMPRAASRIELEITGIRVERVQDISGADAIAEGAIESVQWANEEAKQSWLGNEGYAKGCYRHLWNEINGKKHPWDSNPWVWVVEFKRVDDCQNCVHANQGACCGGVR